MTGPFTVGTAPGAVPVLGHGWQLGRSPVEFLDSLPGFGDLVRVKLGPLDAYVPCHPELLHRVLTDDRIFDKGGPLYERLSEMFGNGLGSCPYRDHRRQRRLVQPTFRQRQLEHYSAAMTADASALADSWRDGQVLDVFPAMFAFSLRTITGSIFSAGLDDPAIREIRRTFETVLHGVVTRMLLPRALLRLPTPGNRRYHDDLATLNTIIDTLIARYRSAPGGRDILSQLLLAGDDQERCPLTDREIHDEVMTIMVAASEAVASNLTWTLWLLSEHPDIDRRLHSETSKVTNGGPARWADIPRLAFTGQVIAETLRLYPAGWLFTRVTTSDTELAGRRLPAGTVVIVSPLPVNRNPAVHDAPLTFDPDRRPGGQQAFAPDKTVVSFGGGARRCIGDSYARTVLTLTLAAIIGRWRLAPAAGTDPRPARLTPNLRPRRVMLRIRER